ncbi:unnamed protein product, partial [Cyprideis torosa]
MAAGGESYDVEDSGDDAGDTAGAVGYIQSPSSMHPAVTSSSGGLTLDSGTLDPSSPFHHHTSPPVIFEWVDEQSVAADHGEASGAYDEISDVMTHGGTAHVTDVVDGTGGVELALATGADLNSLNEPSSRLKDAIEGAHVQNQVSDGGNSEHEDKADEKGDLSNISIQSSSDDKEEGSGGEQQPRTESTSDEEAAVSEHAPGCSSTFEIVTLEEEEEDDHKETMGGVGEQSEAINSEDDDEIQVIPIVKKPPLVIDIEDEESSDDGDIEMIHESRRTLPNSSTACSTQTEEVILDSPISPPGESDHRTYDLLIM